MCFLFQAGDGGGGEAAGAETQGDAQEARDGGGGGGQGGHLHPPDSHAEVSRNRNLYSKYVFKFNVYRRLSVRHNKLSISIH